MAILLSATACPLAILERNNNTITESNFFDYKGNNGVAISRGIPKHWTGRRCMKLAPTYKLLSDWKRGSLSEEDYINIYNREILSNLDKEQIKKELGENAVLLCWERVGFCHRHIVIKWLNS